MHNVKKKYVKSASQRLMVQTAGLSLDDCGKEWKRSKHTAHPLAKDSPARMDIPQRKRAVSKALSTPSKLSYPREYLLALSLCGVGIFKLRRPECCALGEEGEKPFLSVRQRTISRISRA
eukprot:3327715-Rhodomonas_salina.3